MVVNGLSSETTFVLFVFASSSRFRELRSEYKPRSTSVHFICANMFYNFTIYALPNAYSVVIRFYCGNKHIGFQIV